MGPAPLTHSSSLAEADSRAPAEHDEGDDDAASEHPDESDQAEDLLIEDEPEPASPYANPALASLALDVPPRSPGLPSSPRPGATF